MTEEGEGYLALCPELGISCRGATLGEARAALREAVEVWVDFHPDEVERLLRLKAGGPPPGVGGR